MNRLLSDYVDNLTNKTHLQRLKLEQVLFCSITKNMEPLYSKSLRRKKIQLSFPQK